MTKQNDTGFVNLEELFGKPLSDVPDDELLAKAQELRTRRKYPSVEKAAGKKTDKIQDLIQSILVKNNSDDEDELDRIDIDEEEEEE